MPRHNADIRTKIEMRHANYVVILIVFRCVLSHSSSASVAAVDALTDAIGASYIRTPRLTDAVFHSFVFSRPIQYDKRYRSENAFANSKILC